MRGQRLTIVGGGWAGLAAAIAAMDAGWQVTVLEASRRWGGRARRVTVRDASGQPWALDNGQHLLIGAYTATLTLLNRVGVDPQRALQRIPLTVRYPDGSGLALPAWNARLPRALAPLAIALALLRMRGHGWRERLTALAVALRWRRHGYTCDAGATVADLCRPLPTRVRDELFEPLCVAALNTPPEQASGAVFLRVLHDALLGPAQPPLAPSDLLLPRVDLGALLPDTAVAALARGGARLHTSARVTALRRAKHGWSVILADGTVYDSDALILASPVWESARLLATVAADTEDAGTQTTALDAPPPALPTATDAAAPHPAPVAAACSAQGFGHRLPVHVKQAITRWIGLAQGLTHVPIATVYVRAPANWHWPADAPVLALRSDPRHAPAQFAFLHRRSNSRQPYLALVASAPDATLSTDRAALVRAVQRQCAAQLGLHSALVLHAAIEKRATFACTPALQRPPTCIAPALVAAGDAIDGPYPATLEGAVRSGMAAVAALGTPG